MKRVTPPAAGGIMMLVNFPLFWKMCLDMIKAGSGYEFNFEILAPGTDLRERASVSDLVDVAMLPKASEFCPLRNYRHAPPPLPLSSRCRGPAWPDPDVASQHGCPRGCSSLARSR